MSYINTKLKVPCAESDISNAFCVGKFTDSREPRALIVNFARNIKRNEVFSVRKLQGKYEISIYKDLTKNRYQLLQHAKKTVGRRMVWSTGGKVFVIREGKKCIVNSENDLLHHSLHHSSSIWYD